MKRLIWKASSVNVVYVDDDDVCLVAINQPTNHHQHWLFCFTEHQPFQPF